MKSSYKAVEHPSHFELFYEGSDKPLKVSKKGLSPDKVEEIVKHLAIGGVVTEGGNIRGGLALNPSHKINVGKLVIKPIKIKKLAEGGVGVSDSGYMGDPLQAAEEAEKPESSPVFDEEAASPMMKQQYGEKDNADGAEKPQMVIMAAHGGHLKKGDPDTYITKDGEETKRGLWANVYLKKKREGKLADGGVAEYKPPKKDSLADPKKAVETAVQKERRLINEGVKKATPKEERDAIRSWERGLELRKDLKGGKEGWYDADTDTYYMADGGKVEFNEDEETRKANEYLEKIKNNPELRKQKLQEEMDILLKENEQQKQKYIESNTKIPEQSDQRKTKLKELFMRQHGRQPDPKKFLKEKDGKVVEIGEAYVADGGEISGIEATKRGEAKLLAHAAKQEKRMENMAKGGYVVTRSNDRKGKTHKVTNTKTGEVQYFGDSNLGQHPKDPERKAAFYARHAHNLKGNPFFRAYARATWFDGGEIKNFAAGGLDDVDSLEETSSGGDSGEEVVPDELNAKPDEGEGELPERQFFRSEGENGTPGAFGEITRFSPEEAELFKEGKLDLPESDVDRFTKEQAEFLADQEREKPETERSLRPVVFKLGAKIAGANTQDEYEKTLKEIQPLFTKLEPREKKAVAQFMQETKSRLNEPQKEALPVDDVEEGKQSEEGSDEELVSKKEDKKEGTPIADALSKLKGGGGKKPSSPAEAIEIKRSESPVYRKYFDLAMSNPDATPEMADRVATAMVGSIGAQEEVAKQMGVQPEEAKPAPSPAAPAEPTGRERGMLGVQPVAPAAPSTPVPAPAAPAISPATTTTPAPAAGAPYTGPLPNLGVVSAGGVGIPKGATPIEPTPAGAVPAAPVAAPSPINQVVDMLKERGIDISPDAAGQLTPEQIDAMMRIGGKTPLEVYEEATRAGAEAITKQAELNAKGAELTAKVKEKQVAIQIAEQNQFEFERRMNLARREQLRREILSQKVSAKDYWENASTGQKVMTGLGLVLGVIGKGMGGQGSVADFVNKSVQDELDQQMKTLGTKRSMLSDLIQEGNDIESAFAKTQAFYKDLFANQIELLLQQNKIPDQMAAAKAQEALAKFQMESVKGHDEAVKRNIELRFMPEKLQTEATLKAINDVIKLLNLDLNKTRENRIASQGGRGLQLKERDIARKEAADRIKELAKQGTPEEQNALTGNMVKVSDIPKMKKEVRELLVPVYDPATGTSNPALRQAAYTPKDAEKLRDTQISVEEFNKHLRTLKTLAQKYPRGIDPASKFFDAADARAAKDAEDAIIPLLGKMTDLGVLQKSDYDVLKQNIPALTNWKPLTGKASIQQALTDYGNRFNGIYDTRRKALLINPSATGTGSKFRKAGQ